ncbi:hypothetical protein COLO4_33738 [Corchorus olitorius]|uniref:Uncharacterized protein n=1 Tax=Corchorus olitorius TaxID=93759 RepID=A0A1R3GRR2_9ROSI|nr:hypothetical protein COLO4_33738 [Corchorus olitorius]
MFLAGTYQGEPQPKLSYIKFGVGWLKTIKGLGPAAPQLNEHKIVFRFMMMMNRGHCWVLRFYNGTMPWLEKDSDSSTLVQPVNTTNQKRFRVFREIVDGEMMNMMKCKFPKP